jgi:hypothetical protein
MYSLSLSPTNSTDTVIMVAFSHKQQRRGIFCSQLGTNVEGETLVRRMVGKAPAADATVRKIRDLVAQRLGPITQASIFPARPGCLQFNLSDTPTCSCQK